MRNRRSVVPAAPRRAGSGRMVRQLREVLPVYARGADFCGANVANSDVLAVGTSVERLRRGKRMYRNVLAVSPRRTDLCRPVPRNGVLPLSAETRDDKRIDVALSSIEPLSTARADL